MKKEELLKYLENPEIDDLFISINVSESEDEEKRVFLSLNDLEINCKNCNGELQLVADGKIEDA